MLFGLLSGRKFMSFASIMIIERKDIKLFYSSYIINSISNIFLWIKRNSHTIILKDIFNDSDKLI